MRNESGYSNEDVSLDLGSLLAAIWKAKRWIVPLVAIGAVGTFVALQFVSPKYRSDASVLIEAAAPVLGDERRAAEVERSLLDKEGVASQAQLMASRDLARQVAAKLDLSSRPEFRDYKLSFTAGLLSSLGIRRGSDQISQEERVLAAYFESLAVHQVANSRVIGVSFSSTSPEFAAKAANTVVDEYMALQASARRQSTGDTSTILDSEISALRREVVRAENEVADYRAQSDLLLGANNVPLMQQQLSDLSGQLSTAKTAASQSTSKARLLRTLLNSGGSLETVSDVLNSQLIQRLREQQVRLRSRIAELSTTLLANHPEIKALKSQNADYERQIRGEARKILIGLEHDAKIAKQQVAEINSQLSELKAAASQASASQVRLKALEREATVKSTQLEALLRRYRDDVVISNAQNLPVNARIISRAAVPLGKYFPKTTAITVVVGLGLALFSVALVIMREFLRGNALRRTPLAGDFTGYTEDRRSTAGSMPVEPEVEVRSVRAETPDPRPEQHSDIDRLTGHTVFARGKTAIVSLETSAPGRFVALDQLRREAAGHCHPILIEAQSGSGEDRDVAGFSELLHGEASFTDVIFRDVRSRAHVIAHGRQPIKGDDVAGERFDTMASAICMTYDHVIVDLGAFALTDVKTRLLAWADRIIFVSESKTALQQISEIMSALNGNSEQDLYIADPNDLKRTGPSADQSHIAA